jgi:hypothetical protein
MDKWLKREAAKSIDHDWSNEVFYDTMIDTIFDMANDLAGKDDETTEANFDKKVDEYVNLLVDSLSKYLKENGV